MNSPLRWKPQSGRWIAFKINGSGFRRDNGEGMGKAVQPKACEKNIEVYGGPFAQEFAKVPSPAYCGPGPP